jgi:DNA polymerase III sliding clamp (beta) subunit (PCNA family)
MLDALKFVKGAVASKDYVPALTHFRIAGGRAYGYNGVLALSTPIDLDITALPRAVPFTKAIEKLPDAGAVTLNLTKAGRLSISSGNFRAFVDCWPDDATFPMLEPEGDEHAMTGGILPVLRRLAPFMGVDASRQWANGIRLSGQSALATNNVVLVEQWMDDCYVPGTINLPDSAVKEMLRLNQEPVSMRVTARSVSFHYESGAWLRSSLLAAEWPDLSRILDRPNAATPVPSAVFDAVERLIPFVEEIGYVYLTGGNVKTSMAPDSGASVDLDDFGGAGIFNAKQFLLLRDVAERIDFAHWPAPCLFFGDKCRGALVGARA